ncbi:hypothetical protein DPMN_047887 [Dreissena polymorpha]|uniref:RING-type domain-containing protein n=1 Tax=Dreissena polymorpha TaxID=45954 RepID=A0A9D4D9K9_DREPO|nr:hypothetical protein DPMN_047887 [Dreissena polymorpha]
MSDTFVEENKRLRSMSTCDKCKTNQSNALFLPCAHHVMCIDCARDLKLCPVCNRKVDETIRTFMS